MLKGFSAAEVTAGAMPTAIETKQNLYTAYSLANSKNRLHSMLLSRNAALFYTRGGHYL